MTTFSYFCLIIVSVLCFCYTNAAGNSNSWRIVGGYRPAQHTLAKHIVSLRVRKRETENGFGAGHFCGGSILAPNVILSAAHCHIDRGTGKTDEPTDIYIVAGSPQRLIKEENSQIIEVAEVVVHEGFVHNFFQLKHDIALLRLAANIQEDGLTAQRILMASGKTAFGTICTAVGWGNFVPYGPKAAEANYVDLELLSNTKCKRLFGPTILHILNSHTLRIRKTIICAHDQSSHKGTCQGDSGGPLFCNGQLVGISSFVDMPCGDGVSAFTNVFCYRDWIEKHAIRWGVQQKIFGGR